MHEKVLEFWFNELKPKQWWTKDPHLDETIDARFGQLHNKAKLGELFSWRESAHGCLAEVIILDQFSRNIHRGKAHSFACDAQALALSQSAISNGTDTQLSAGQRVFLYMPFMHSESQMIHVEAVKLFKALGIEQNLNFEYKHKEIIDKFGRYPHRNKILGRESTPEEIEFLKQPNSGF